MLMLRFLLWDLPRVGLTFSSRGSILAPPNGGCPRSKPATMQFFGLDQLTLNQLPNTSSRVPGGGPFSF